MFDIIKLNDKETESFSKKILRLIPTIIPFGKYEGKVSKVCDGDTIWLIINSNRSY
jgi:hypothetical protein